MEKNKHKEDAIKYLKEALECGTTLPVIVQNLAEMFAEAFNESVEPSNTRIINDRDTGEVEKITVNDEEITNFTQDGNKVSLPKDTIEEQKGWGEEFDNKFDGLWLALANWAGTNDPEIYNAPREEIKSFISQVEQSAREKVLLGLITENLKNGPSTDLRVRGVVAEYVLDYAKSLGINLLDSK